MYSKKRKSLFSNAVNKSSERKHIKYVNCNRLEYLVYSVGKETEIFILVRV